MAKGNAPVITTVTGAGISGALKYLELFNSFAGLVGVLMMAFGSYWMYRKNRSESLKADAETERIKLENDRIKIENEEKLIQIEVQSGAVKFIEVIARVIEARK